MIQNLKERLKSKPSTFLLIEMFMYELHLLNVRLMSRLSPFKRKKIRELKKKKNVKLHWGCGSTKLPGWTNIDGWKSPATDLVTDLRESIPLSNNSTSFIFTEHVLEHVTIEEGAKVLKEFYRILNTNGVARIVVPDLELCCEAFIKGELSWFKKVGIPAQSSTAGMGFNSIFYNHSHRYIYDYDSLVIMLKEAGFKKISKSSFNGSIYEELQIDKTDESRQLVSLYVEAIK